MPFPYKKMTEEDFAYIRKVTSADRVWVGDEIASEYYHDEMPEYGIFPPELYVEVLDKYEVSAIMKYAWEQNIPVVVRGAGTGLAGGANCKFGGILLSVMKMNKMICLDKANMTMTVQPGMLLTDVATTAMAEGLFYPYTTLFRSHKCGWNACGSLWTDERFCALYRGSASGWRDRPVFFQCREKYNRI